MYVGPTSGRGTLRGFVSSVLDSRRASAGWGAADTLGQEGLLQRRLSLQGCRCPTREINGLEMKSGPQQKDLTCWNSNGKEFLSCAVPWFPTREINVLEMKSGLQQRDLICWKVNCGHCGAGGPPAEEPLLAGGQVSNKGNQCVGNEIWSPTKGLNVLEFQWR